MAALTQAYARRIAQSKKHPLTPQAQDVAVLGFTDALGVMLAGAKEPSVQALSLWAYAQGGAQQSRVIGRSARLPASHAALLNATAAHALDYDDFAFSNHPSAVLVPTILAAADAHASPVSGETLLRAYAIGYEVWADIFLREKDLYYDKGWHPTAVLGSLGAAAAASVVWEHNELQSQDALALAASAAGGIFENFGTMAKPYHGGRAASVGLTAASMAAFGLHASPSAIEGRHGLLRAFSPQGNVDTDRAPPLENVWSIESRRLNIKKYPVVGAAQRCIDAMLNLMGKQNIDPSHIVKIVAKVSVRHAAVMPYHLPQDALQAKFSLEYAIVSALLYDNVGFAELQDDKVRHESAQHLMRLVQIQTTEEFEPDWRDAAPFDQVDIYLEGGSVISTEPVRRATGHADTPLSAAEIHKKFMGCVRFAGIRSEVGEALYQWTQSLPTLSQANSIPWPEFL